MRSIDVTDYYGGGTFAHRWSIVDGWPRCLVDAYRVADTAPDVLAAQLAANAAVRTAIAAVEQYEAAERLVAIVAMRPAEPPDRLSGVAPDGQVVDRPNPEWLDWQAAVRVCEAATDLTRAYAVVRRGAPPSPADGAEPSAEWVAYEVACDLIRKAG